MIKLFLIFLLIIFILVLAGAGCDRRPLAPFEPSRSGSQNTQFMSNEKVNLVTSDGVTIIGDYAKPAGAKSAVLMLHMMPATKESWQSLSELLNKKGLATLAIDLRGHGESLKGSGGRVLNFRNFSDQEHQASRLDAVASLEFLKKEGFDLSKVAVVGASIGANLALQALAEQPEIKKAVALSPGLDYKGITTKFLLKKIAADQQVFLIASDDDAYSADSVRALAQEKESQTKLKIYDRAGHGTTMWQAEPTLLINLTDWLIRN